MNQGMSSFTAPPLSKTNKVLLMVFVGAFLLQSIAKLAFDTIPEATFGLTGVGFLNGYVFQILTYPFVQPGFFNILFNSLVLWFFGSDLEMRWGQTFYLKYLAVSVLGGAFLYLMVVVFVPGSLMFSTPLMGLQGICFSILVAYAILNSEAIIPFMLLFPMKAKYFCMLLIGIELYSGIFSAGGKASWGHLGGMGVGYLFLVWESKKARSTKDNKVGIVYKTPKKRKNAHLRLVKEEDDKANPDKPKFWQ
jgi:membrane associated rhomboid family serine protease